jgi:Ca2+-binding EF-hand superfamily protein
MDLDQDGALNREEIRVAMSRGGYNPTDEEIESMFREGGISLLKY